MKTHRNVEELEDGTGYPEENLEKLGTLLITDQLLLYLIY